MSSMEDAIKANEASVTASRKKPLAKSLTVRASLLKAIVPIFTFWLSRKLELDMETSALIAGALFGVLSGISTIGMRRAIGYGLILLCLNIGGCKTMESRMDRRYVEADQATLDAVGPRLLYLESEQGSPLEQKLAKSLCDSWQKRIDEEEKSWR